MGGFGVPMGVSEGSIGVLRPPPWGSGATMGVLGSSHWDFEVSIGVWGHCWGSGGLHCGFGVSIGFFGAHFWGSGATVGAFGVSIGVWGHYWAFGVSSLWFWEVSIGTLGPTIAVLGSFHWGIWHLHWFFGLPVGISPLPSPPPFPPQFGGLFPLGSACGFWGYPIGIWGSPLPTTPPLQAAALDVGSKEQKDAALDRRIAALRKKNEALVRRYQVCPHRALILPLLRLNAALIVP